MKKKYRFFLMALLLIFVGCSEEVVKIDQPIIGENPTRTIKVKATVGDDEIGTRVAMQQEGFDVNLTWEIGDEINLVFTDGVNFIHSTTLVTDVSSNGRRAEFEVVVPDGSDADTFDLYGYYGGGPLIGEAGSVTSGEMGIVDLPAGPWGGTLPELEGADLIMLRFEATDLEMESPEINVTFHHVGSLFKIFLENTSTQTYNDVSNVEIYAVNNDGTENEALEIFAHQNIGTTATAQYDVVSDEFVTGTTTFLNRLSFTTAGADDNFGPSEILELWGWYPPSQVEGHAWPALKVRIIYNGGVDSLETNDYLAAKPTPTAIGRAYHFYVHCDGTSMSFSDAYKQKMTDSRDQSQYNTIQIGDQTWMAENLKYYPNEPVEISLPGIESPTDPYYYVYGFDGDAGGAETLQAFILGGTLYNWAAALDGEEGSDTSPSGVGICPEGWHIPSGAEWGQMITAVGDDAGTILKDRLWWQEEDGGIDSTNDLGFNARPGGMRNSTTPYYSGLLTNGYWLTSDDVGTGEMRVVSMAYNASGVEFINLPRENAVSIRCVKD